MCKVVKTEFYKLIVLLLSDLDTQVNLVSESNGKDLIHV